MRAWEQDLGRCGIRHEKGSEMAVGGLTAEALRCLGSYDPLISHAHGHAKRPAIRSLNSVRYTITAFSLSVTNAQ